MHIMTELIMIAMKHGVASNQVSIENLILFLLFTYKTPNGSAGKTALIQSNFCTYIYKVRTEQ